MTIHSRETPTPPANPTSALLAELDQLLFSASGWFLLDAGRDKLGKVDDVNLMSGLAAVADPGTPAVAVVGHVTEPVIAIDIDAGAELAGVAGGGRLGDRVVEELAGWLVSRGRWHIVRPSGGAPGRWHLFCIPGSDRWKFKDLVADVRATHGLGGRQVDWRRPIRPLSSPHCNGTNPLPLDLERLPALLAEARELLRPAPAGKTSTATKEPVGQRTRAVRAEQKLTDRGRVVPLVPLPRRRVPLAEAGPRGAAFAAWFAGDGPAPKVGGQDLTRSALEKVATGELVRAGYDVKQAWEVIAAAHENAMTHTRADNRGRQWWIQYLWNKAVAEDTAYRRAAALDRGMIPESAIAAPEPENRGPESRSDGLSAPSWHQNSRTVVAAAREALRDSLWGFGPEARHTMRVVMETLLDRMHWENTLTVPCPKRWLVEQTGLSGQTVLTCLKSWDGVLGRREETYDPADPSSSHSWVLTAGDLPEIPESRFRPVSRTPPGWVGSTLPAPALSLWRELVSTPPADRDPHGWTLDDLAQAAALTHSPTEAPTPTQRRRARAHLEALVAVGLVEPSRSAAPDPTSAAPLVVPDRWQLVADDPEEAETEERRARAVSRAAADLAERRERHAAERAADRAGRARCTSSAWVEGRDAAAAKDQGRRQSWWDSLSEAERLRLRQAMATGYRSLSQDAQAARKEQLAERRRRAAAAGCGYVDEHQRHRSYSAQWTTDEQAAISDEWLERWRALSPAEQFERRAHLDQHRAAWRVPRTWSAAADQPELAIAS